MMLRSCLTVEHRKPHAGQALHQRLARDQLGFLDSRNDAGAVQDRLIIKRRFGQGEKRTMLVGGVAFEA